MNYKLITNIFCLFFSVCFANTQIDEKVENLLKEMTIDEKIGQMTQIDRRFLRNDNDIIKFGIGSILSGGGSVPEDNSIEGWANMYDHFQELSQQTRLKIPLIYGIDAVHGHNNVNGATIFPHNIGLGCTFDSDIVYRVADITAREVSATGIDWNFAPCLSIPQDERWGRYYEGYSEDANQVAELGLATIKGYQNVLGSNHSIAACAKHFLGDGATLWGTGDNNYKIDRGNAIISKEKEEEYLLPYKKAIDNGVLTVMASFNSYNGLKCHASSYLFNDLLKGQLNFEGFVISDWRGIDEIPGDYKSDIITSINSGIDMVMVPGDTIWGGQPYHKFLKLFRESVNEGSIKEERLDDAVRRILKAKYKLGLFENPYTDRSYIPDFGSYKHRQVAREAVRKSLVLLKNEDNILPLSKNMKSIHVAGVGANDIGMQCGGWTMEWQGKMGMITEGTTILEGIQSAVSPSTKISYSLDGKFDDNADIGIVVIGEEPYAEGIGDKEELYLSEKDKQVLSNMKKHNIPLIVIMLSGRPLIITEEIKNWDAFIAAWLPGSEGNGVADVLFGDYKPTGKLSFAWPKSMDQIPLDYNNESSNPMFNYQFGLTY